MSKQYLKIIKRGSSEYLESMSILKFRNRKDPVLVIKEPNSSAIYVEGGREMETLLAQTGHGFVKGFLDFAGSKMKFTANFMNFVQLNVGNIKELSVGDEIDMTAENFYADPKRLIPKLQKLVSEQLSTPELKVIAIPNYEEHRRNFIFEIYQSGVGESKAVHLVHPELGLSRLLTRQEFKGEKILIKLESHYNIFHLAKETPVNENNLARVVR